MKLFKISVLNAGIGSFYRRTISILHCSEVVLNRITRFPSYAHDYFYSSGRRCGKTYAGFKLMEYQKQLFEQISSGKALTAGEVFDSRMKNATFGVRYAK